jgi:hypothetical protein
MTETKDALPALTDVTHVDVLVAEPSLQGDPAHRAFAHARERRRGLVNDER